MDGKELPLKFGCNVFSDKVMKSVLKKEVYESVVNCKKNGTSLSRETAKEVAIAMKNWAIEKGATHYTHWFQPMTGITAEKHDSFLEPTGDGDIIMNFSEKSLIRGESDASSLPSGGLRASFEARGYTAWDPTSYAFIKDGSLYIPTAFCSYGGEALDKKTPLLRSMDALNKQTLRILKLFNPNSTVEEVLPMVGAEQEYFLIDKDVYEKRIDLIHCGRTLFGARPSKGQELNDHYYGAIKSRVLEFMKDLDEELYKLGVYAKTKHNESAPAQHELATFYCSANSATDQNQLTMEMMKTVASRHNLVCLLSEKPFASVTGSGKHVNWSIKTDLGENLLEPGATPKENARFLLFLTAMIKAVDEYQDLLRISVATASNDNRLGEHEAPPAIISMFIGEELEDILHAIAENKNYDSKSKTELKIGVSALPSIPKDSTDRNRTSPFAFTGNKFEFRMVGSSANIACPVFIINTIVANALSEFADILEKANNFDEALKDIIKTTINKHSKILFSGNNYSKEWLLEAKARGLLNLKTAVDALPLYEEEKNINLFNKMGVLSTNEIHSRMEILLENYANIIHIESLTMVDIANKEITPSIISYENFLLEEINNKKILDKNLSCTLESKIASILAENSEKYSVLLDKLTKDSNKFGKIDSNIKKARFCRDILIPDMKKLREVADNMELVIGKKFYAFPTYEDILYSVKY